MTFVLDASAVLAVAFSELDPLRQASLFTRIAHEGVRVPGIFPVEVANSLEIGRRRGRIGSDKIDTFVGDLVRLPIAVQLAGLEQIGSLRQLAEIHALSAYDTAYLALALSDGLALVTLDRALERAARDAGLSVTPP